MQNLRRGSAALAVFMLLAACGSDDKPHNDGWATNENVPEAQQPDVEVDAGSDVSVTPDVSVEPRTCETTGCAPGEVCYESACVTFECTNDDLCPDGLACVGDAGARTCQQPTGAADGEACAQDSDCQGGTCITDFPGGYCTTRGCETYEDCSRLGNENRCMRVRGPDICVRICQADADCREGYVCMPLNGSQGACFPDPNPPQPIDTDALTSNPFDVTCVDAVNNSAVINYTVGADATSYMITPLTPSGKRLRPNAIDRPSGETINFNGPNAFQAIPSEIFNINPLVVPAISTFSDQIEPGDHQLKIDTQADQVCWYKLEETAKGDTLDVNVYLVGIPGLDAQTAPTHEHLQATLRNFDAIYRTAGFHLGQIRYIDVSDDLAAQYAVIRDEGTIPNLLRSTTRPGDTLDDVLSVNVFFVRQFQMGGTIGISYGLPGPAGLHSSPFSGVVFTAQYMGGITTDGLGTNVDGNIFTSQVLAHEVGHYLGLFHTSESNGFSFDPIADTPQCQQIGQNCPDLPNLMFPFASSMSAEITDGQAFVMGVNPLTKTVAQPGDQP